MSKIDRMITFTEVVKAESFRQAAKKLAISPAAVSKQVALLEKELATTLLKRTTRKIELTQEGALFYENLERTLKEIDEIESELLSQKKEPKGRLKVLCSPHFAKLFIIPHLQEFYTRFPKLLIELLLEERIPDLDKEKIDILIGMSLSGPPDCIQKKIATTRYVLCASPSYLKKQGTPKKPDDLKQHHYIAHSMRKPNDILTFTNKKEITVHPILSINDSQAMVQAAISGLGIIKAHEYAVKSALIEKKLIELLPEYNKAEIPIWVCYQQRPFLPSKIRLFIDFFEKLLRT